MKIHIQCMLKQVSMERSRYEEEKSTKNYIKLVLAPQMAQGKSRNFIFEIECKPC